MHNTGGQAACLTLCGGGVAGTLHARADTLRTYYDPLLYDLRRSTYTQETRSDIRALMSPKRKHAMQGGTVGVGWVLGDGHRAETPQNAKATGIKQALTIEV